MAAKNKSRCKAKTRAGKPCGAAATACGLCFFHANPDKARELGRSGGRKNRRSGSQNLDPSFTLDTARAIRDAGERLFKEVRAGEVTPRTAEALASILRLQGSVIPVTDLEQRVQELERQLAEKSKSGDGAGEAFPLDSGELPKAASLARRQAQPRTNGSGKPQ